MTPLNYDLYLYQFVCMDDSFKLWSLSLSVCVYGMTPLNYDLYLTSVCVIWMTPLNYDQLSLSVCVELEISFKLSDYLYQCVWLDDSF